MQRNIYLFCFQILLLHVSDRILWDFFPFSYFWLKSSKQKQVCTGKTLATVVNSEQPEVTVFEQLTADNHAYGAAHTALAKPHHIIMLLRDRVWTVEQIISYYHFQKKFFLLNFRIHTHSNVEGFFSLAVQLLEFTEPFSCDCLTNPISPELVFLYKNADSLRLYLRSI